MLKFGTVRQMEIALEELTAFSERCNVSLVRV